MIESSDRQAVWTEAVSGFRATAAILFAAAPLPAPAFATAEAFAWLTPVLPLIDAAPLTGGSVESAAEQVSNRRPPPEDAPRPPRRFPGGADAIPARPTAPPRSAAGPVSPAGTLAPVGPHAAAGPHLAEAAATAPLYSFRGRAPRPPSGPPSPAGGATAPVAGGAARHLPGAAPLTASGRQTPIEHDRHEWGVSVDGTPARRFGSAEPSAPSGAFLDGGGPGVEASAGWAPGAAAHLPVAARLDALAQSVMAGWRHAAGLRIGSSARPPPGPARQPLDREESDDQRPKTRPWPPDAPADAGGDTAPRRHRAAPPLPGGDNGGGGALDLSPAGWQTELDQAALLAALVAEALAEEARRYGVDLS